MKVFTSMTQWQTFRQGIKEHPLGFVPTMGALHQGHLSLVEASRETDLITIASIFVNPRQFDDKRDFDAYPSDYQSDLEMLEAAGVHFVLMPETGQIYADDYRFKVMESEFSHKFCGAHRPGHFDGVLTVVMRLLNLVRPDNAYFGEKDYQQLKLISDMVTAFFVPVNIVACQTIREEDGLAMSSRNRRLDKKSRQLAPELYAAIRNSATADEATEILLEKGFDVDYVEDIADRRLAAVRMGDTRLIDNVKI
jgi:pantoate--beta-alanine ligase